jgi:uncharacterized membrane protein YqaE (UPF0057 family)
MTQVDSFVSPIPVLMIRGCGADFIINICTSLSVA